MKVKKIIPSCPAINRRATDTRLVNGALEARLSGRGVVARVCVRREF
ncbi:MAG: hypothetical protein JXA33_15875 [Anaerolineae bacterium]|nr:hypothetical protein [Anaerolineae bacterium]